MCLGASEGGNGADAVSAFADETVRRDITAEIQKYLMTLHN
jgi:hypothetical protein